MKIFWLIWFWVCIVMSVSAIGYGVATVEGFWIGRGIMVGIAGGVAWGLAQREKRKEEERNRQKQITLVGDCPSCGTTLQVTDWVNKCPICGAVFKVDIEALSRDKK